METVYFYSAVIGGAFLVIQTLLLAFGGIGDGADHLDVDPTDLSDASAAGHGADHGIDAADAAQNWFLKVLSLKTLVGFATFFGLTGLGGHAAGWGHGGTLAAAILAGLVAVYLVAWLMSALHRLQSSGNVNLRNAIGLHARVYLRVPGAREGIGKVTVTVQGRVVECKAITAGSPIPTGAQVLVVAVEAADTLAVEPLPA